MINFTFYALHYLAECYRFRIYEDSCKKNETVFKINGVREKSGLMIQSYTRTWDSSIRNCTVSVIVKPQQGIVMCILYVYFTYGCSRNEYLKFTSDNESIIFCDTYRKPTNITCFMFPQTYVNFSYNTEQNIPPKFQLMFSSFERPPCSLDSFACRNHLMCIWTGYICDGFNNCLDNSDEYIAHDTSECSTHIWIWILFFGILPLIILTCCCIFIGLLTKKNSGFISRANFYISNGELHSTSSVSNITQIPTLPYKIRLQKFRPLKRQKRGKKKLDLRVKFHQDISEQNVSSSASSSLDHKTKSLSMESIQQITVNHTNDVTHAISPSSSDSIENSYASKRIKTLTDLAQNSEEDTPQTSDAKTNISK